MAVSWGAWNSTTRLRTGIDVLQSPATVTAATTQVTLTVRNYLQTRYASSDSGGQWWLTGAVTASGSKGWNLPAMGTVLMGEASVVVPLVYGSAQSRAFSARTRSAFAYPGVETTANRTWTVPARPGAAPAAPSNVTAVRNSDAQASVSWTRNPTSAAPYTSQTVQMRTFSGSSWGGWGTVATLSGTASSYIRTGLTSNRAYQFRVYAANTVGNSGYGTSGEVWMTPAAPTRVFSALTGSGGQITTTWVDNSYLTATRSTFNIQRSVNGGTYTTVTSGVSGLSWTDPTPGIGSNRYRVQAKGFYTTLTSPYAEGNLVTTVVAPAAPTLGPPNGEAHDFTDEGGTWFSWTHNDGGDGAAQTAYEIEYRPGFNGSWSPLLADTSSLDTVNLPAGVLTNGVTYTYRVRTRGIPSAGFGAWSDIGVVTGADAPVVTIVNPGPVVTELPVTVDWIYAQVDAVPQAESRVLLAVPDPDAGPGDDRVVVEEAQAAGAGTSYTFSTRMQDGDSYEVIVLARSGQGIWSEHASVVFTVDLPVPAGVDVAAGFDPCESVTVLHVTPLEPGPGEVQAESIEVARRVEGGEWVVLATGLPVPVDFIDPVPLTNGRNEYQITAISGIPSFRVMPTFDVDGTDGDPGTPLWVSVRYGPGFSRIVKFQGDPEVGTATGREQDAVTFLGRDDPVLLLGDRRSYVVNASGAVQYGSDCGPPPEPCGYPSSPAEWEDAGQDAELVCYRDYTGRRFFGMLSGMSVSDEAWTGIASVSFSVTRTDYTERYLPTPDIPARWSIRDVAERYPTIDAVVDEYATIADLAVGPLP